MKLADGENVADVRASTATEKFAGPSALDIANGVRQKHNRVFGGALPSRRDSVSNPSRKIEVDCRSITSNACVRTAEDVPSIRNTVGQKIAQPVPVGIEIARVIWQFCSSVSI
jgi:hypothetical protein